MNIRQGRYLIAVSDHGSFTRAAAELNVSQPALSQQIRQLEDSLGAQLLDRSSRTLNLTDAGRTYIAYVRRALQELDAAQRAIHDVEDLTGGTLRLAFLPLFTTYMVGPVVTTFHRRYPRVTLSVDILAQAAMEAALTEDTLDVGIAFSDIASREVEAEPLCQENLCLIVGEEHPAFGSAELPVTSLSDTDFALLGPAFVTRAPIDLYLLTNAVNPRIAIESNSVDSLMAIVRGSRLATIFPESSARDVAGLHAIRLVPPIATRNVSILMRDRGYRSAAMRAFAQMLREWSWAAPINGKSLTLEERAPEEFKRSST